MYSQFNALSLSGQQPQASANQSQSGVSNLGVSGGNDKPKKYITVNGVMKLNPEYKKLSNGAQQPATTVLHPDQALAVVSNMDDYMEANQAVAESGQQERPLATSTQATIEIMQDDPGIAKQVGLDADELVDGLGEIFQKNEIPMGLMNKLMMLSEYSRLEFIVDDSGSMQCHSDTKDQLGRPQSRWQEAESRMKTMLEVLAYVPVQKIEVRFLNRQDVVELNHAQGERPEAFLAKSLDAVTKAFSKRPAGGTPVRQKLEESLNRGRGQNVARYLFCDGQPSGGEPDKTAITQMLMNRQNPAQNPVTLLSCTNEDAEVEWMKEAEEVAPFCAELDDFADEAREVAKDQGPAFPFTKGFHLICQIVGAMNPDDLDAMDESAPFTQATMSNLLGVEVSADEYRHYFDHFCANQESRPAFSHVDRAKKDVPFSAHYNAFCSTPVAKDIEVVKIFKEQIKLAMARDAGM